MSSWFIYNEGRSIGQARPEGAVILLDDEHKSGARITLKRGDKYVSVSCNIYGWIDHTRLFASVPDAEREYKSMKTALGKLIDSIASAGENSIKGWEEISEFVRRFP